MNNELLTAVIETLFGGFMPYIAPAILISMALLFGDRVINLVYTALETNRRR